MHKISIVIKSKNEDKEALEMKIFLCKIGKKLGFEVDIEEVQETELGKLAIRHDLLWYTKQPDWITKLFNIILSRNDLNPEYRKLKEKQK